MPDDQRNAKSIDFLVRRDDLRACRFESHPTPALGPDQALLAIDAFGFTANNVTYAVFGEMMRYWQFFPAPAGFGRVPVWGFANVVASRHPSLVEGERFYGYFPLSTHLLVEPVHPTAGGFIDGAAHRRDLPPVYNNYVRTSTDPGYDPRREDAQMLLRPLFGTAFLIDDLLDEQAFSGARAIVLSSASSKTAIALAHLLSKRPARAYEVIGLTSPRNAAFVTGLGFYDRTVTYDALDQVPSNVPLVFVDMAGDGAVRDAVHRRAGENVRYSCAVGGTHWHEMTPAVDLPGAPPTFFFAPDRFVKRSADWGSSGLQTRIGEAWKDFVGSLGGWLRVERGGRADVERVYLATLDGRADPAVGYVLSL
jgi:hypothetical protein